MSNDELASVIAMIYDATAFKLPDDSMLDELIHQLSSTQYAVNAQGRTETWYRSLPHYVMLHVVYHWNKNLKR